MAIGTLIYLFFRHIRQCSTIARITFEYFLNKYERLCTGNVKEMKSYVAKSN